MPNRIYCLACKTFYRKASTGVNVELANRMIIRGDLYQCPNCGHTVYGDFGEPFESRP